ncbi:Aerobic respiration control sensor protein ArcB [Thiorhodovibrio winogradskyi]|uniref:histidine kinase n=1 Tax=Thiorhodovibrio winogradskyi TaxID=77007 RepID=A0ABZ0SE18_9GAMM|nr:AAA family ATPase [Thiorhodovibrio winogradskyi]
MPHRSSLPPRPLIIPEHLYGRDSERGVLLDAFARIAQGTGEILLVPGPSGVGKTALVQQLKQPVLASNGRFCAGKFSQYQQGVPHLAMRQALASLGRSLTEDNSSGVDWPARLQAAVGDFGHLLTGLAPELTPLLGTPAPPPDISPLEARHRFATVLRRFLAPLCQPEHPLVIFIDDWQWADAASLAVLESLEIGTTLRYLLLIAAYRDDEVDEAHPFRATLGSLKHQHRPIKTLAVRPLGLSAQQDFLLATLEPTLAEPAELAHMMHRHTQGNPLFMRAFLGFIHEAGLLAFDPDQQRWQWSPEDFDAMALEGDVVEFLAHRFRQLAPAQRALLVRAACLGNRFALADLALLSGRPASQCLDLLREEIDAGLLLLTDSRGDSDEITDPAHGKEADYWVRFVHDRVQQAAHGLIDPASLRATKLDIGRTLLRELPPTVVTERLFELAELLDAGQELIENRDEKLRLLELNLATARQARAATAYRGALRYHRAAAALLEEEAFADWVWHNHHQTAMDLSQDWAGSEFLEGDHALAERLLRQAAERAGSALERAQVLNGLIVQYTLQARYADAIAAGREALAALGVSLPAADFEAARDAEIARVRATLAEQLAGQPIATLAERAPMTDSTQGMVGCLLIAMGPPCYRAHQRLWSVIVPMVVNLTLRHGNLPQIGYSHTAFAGLMIWVEDDFATARAFSDLAEQLMGQHFQAPSDQSVFRLMIGSSARFWFEHLERSSADYAQAYDIGLRAGNLQYAAYAFGHRMYCRFFQGIELTTLREETEESLKFSRTRFNQWAIDLLEGGLLIIDSLSKIDTEQARRTSAENDWLERVTAHDNPQVLCIYRILKSFTLLLLGRHADALTVAEEVEPALYMVGTQGLLPWPMHLYSRFLTLSALYPWVDPARQHRWNDELITILGRLQRWGAQNPANFSPMTTLAEAELARLHGDAPRAMHKYVTATGLAQAGRFLHWEGFIAERAAWFWESQDNDRVAQGCWQQAYDAFARWGAKAKLQAMEIHYRDWISARLPPTGGNPETEQMRAAVVERQIKLLRLQSAQTQETGLRYQAERQAAELAEATLRLREEVAQRKAAEAELRESEARFRLTFDESPVGAGIVSLDLRYQRANAAMCRFLGYTQAQMRNMSVADITYPDDLAGTRDLAAKLLTGEIAETHLDKRYLRADRTSVWGRLSVSLIRDNQGQPLYFLTLVEDITKAKATEQALRRASEEAQAASRAKSEFLANMSHEIRTPLNGVLGMLQLLEETRLTKEQGEYTCTALSCSKRLEALLTDILDLSRIEAGKLSLTPAPLRLADLREAVMDIFSLAATEKGLTLAIEILPGLPERILGDELRLRQVLLNLVGNAIKYSDGGQVSVTLSPFLATDSAPARIAFEVRDTGRGIPPEDIERVFQPFFQSSPKPGSVSQGAGLGLSIVQRLLGLMDGHIEVKSTLGFGTTVRFTLPLQAVNSQTTPLLAASENVVVETKRASLHLLVVDDEPTNLLVARRLLEKSGHRVQCANNGLEALEALRGTAFDALLMDVQMPGMNGLETTQAIRDGAAGAERARVPIIAMTAHAMRGDEERFLAQGMDAYASKPIDRLELLATIERIQGLG